MDLTLCNQAFIQMAGHAGSAYPGECCGILLGRVTGEDGPLFRLRDSIPSPALNIKYTIESACPGTNKECGSKSKGSFLMDSLEFYQMEREAEKRGMAVLGFYHSHPDQEAIVSQRDQRYMVPELPYLILSVNHDGVRMLRAYCKKSLDGEISEIVVKLVFFDDIANRTM